MLSISYIGICQTSLEKTPLASKMIGLWSFFSLFSLRCPNCPYDTVDFCFSSFSVPVSLGSIIVPLGDNPLVMRF